MHILHSLYQSHAKNKTKYIELGDFKWQFGGLKGKYSFVSWENTVFFDR